MDVFQVRLDVDNYRSLISVDPDVIKNRVFALDGTSKENAWPSELHLQFDNAGEPDPDIYSCGIGNMLLYDRSLRSLKEIVEKNCELLPVRCDQVHGFIANVVGFDDCLDSRVSAFVSDSLTGQPLFIRDFAFHVADIPRDRFFKIREAPFRIFVAKHNGPNCVVNQIERTGLTGLLLEKVWSDVS